MAQKISQMTEQTTASMTEAGTSDFLGGYTATGGNANRKFSLSGLANYFLNKFKMTLGGSSQTVKSAIDTLNSKIQRVTWGSTYTFTCETNHRFIIFIGKYTLYTGVNYPDRLVFSPVCAGTESITLTAERDGTTITVTSSAQDNWGVIIF